MKKANSFLLYANILFSYDYYTNYLPKKSWDTRP